MRLPDVRALLAGHLAGRPTRANFRTGTLTVCTMVPMRSVPHRVVCLVGLDDGVFPRLGLVDGDDVLAREPVTGERDIRSEDRQLLLDAIGAATETLVVTYTGANEHSGQPRPPAVPLGELLDALDLTTPERCGRAIVVEHPLQPFDVRNVTPGGLGVPTPFTFDPAMLAAAETAARPRPRRPAFLAEPLAAVPAPGDVRSTDLVAFFRDPVKGFFRPLDVTLPWEVDGVSDAMPVEIDQLETWGVGDRMLADMLRVVHPDQALEREWRRGALPPGQLGWRKAGEVRDQAMPLAIAALTHRQVAPAAYDVDVDLGGGRRLTGTVGPVYGDRLVAVGYSRLDGKHLLESWVRLLALAARDPTTTGPRSPSAGRRAAPARRQRLLGPADEAPDVLLRDLVAVYDAGRREPLPLPLKTSFAWASARATPATTRCEAAGRSWQSGTFPGEDAEPAHVRVWGEHAPLSTPARAAPGPARRSRARPPGSARWPRGCGCRCSAASGEPVSTGMMSSFDLLGDAAAPARARPCSRPAPAPARPSRSPALVTRYVAEGGPRLDEMLLITFGRAASQELRERVRDQLVAAARALDDPDTPATTTCSTATWPPARDAELAERRHRGCATRSPASTPPRSRPPTSSASSCCARWASPATPTPASRWSRASTSWSPRSSTTSTCAASASSKDAPALTRDGRAGAGPRGRRQPAHDADARAARSPARSPASASGSPREVLAELERRKRRLGILGYDDLLSRLADGPAGRTTPRPASGCAGAGGS